MAIKQTYVDSRDVYKQFGEMLGVDLGKCRSAVIHLQADGPVLVDLLGITAERPVNGFVDVTTLADKCQRLEPVDFGQGQ